MEMKLIKEKDVPLLGRKRINLYAKFVGKSTPTKIKLRQDVAKLVKSKPELVVIRHIYQKFGAGEAKIIAHVYNDATRLKQFEGEKALLKAEAPKAEAPKAEAPKAEAPKAEAPKAEAPKAEAPKAEAPKAEEKSE
jgi:ribosomal protein S24E